MKHLLQISEGYVRISIHTDHVKALKDHLTSQKGVGPIEGSDPVTNLAIARLYDELFNALLCIKQ